MALPVTISGVTFPSQTYYLGPFKSGGAFYIVFVESADISVINVYKATDPTDSFSIQDTANDPDVTSTIRSMAVVKDGTDLHISTWAGTGPEIRRHVFHMATDLWDGTLVNEEVEDIDDIPPSANQFSWIEIRSDGDVIVQYSGDTDSIHGVARRRVDYARKEGSTWTRGVLVYPGAWTRKHLPLPGLSGCQSSLQ